MSANEKGKKAKAAGGDKGDKGAAAAGGAKKSKAVKGSGDRFDDGSNAKSRSVNILDEAAMENAYNICHSVQDLLYFRGFFWEGNSKKGKGKGRKKKGKSK
jgi:hypothetical protein